MNKSMLMSFEKSSCLFNYLGYWRSKLKPSRWANSHLPNPPQHPSSSTLSTIGDFGKYLYAGHPMPSPPDSTAISRYAMLTCGRLKQRKYSIENEHRVR